MHRLGLLCWLSLLSVPAWADDVVAIASIQGDMPDAKRAQAEGSLREAVETFAPVQSAKDTAAHIKAARALDIKCSGHDNTCWRRVRELAGVDRMFVPVFRGGKLEVDLVTRAASIDKRGEIPLASNLIVGAARRVVARMLDVRAQLTVLCNVAGAVVEVDGKPVSQAPMTDPVEGIKPGEHKLRVYADGFIVETRTFVVEPGEDAVLQVDLTAEDTASGPTGLWWTGAGLSTSGVVIAAGGGVYWALMFAEAPAPGLNETVEDYLERRAANDVHQGIGIAALATGAALVVAGTIILMSAPGDSE